MIKRKKLLDTREKVLGNNDIEIPMKNVIDSLLAKNPETKKDNDRIKTFYYFHEHKTRKYKYYAK